jgi:hypothetical protein
VVPCWPLITCSAKRHIIRKPQVHQERRATAIGGRLTYRHTRKLRSRTEWPGAGHNGHKELAASCRPGRVAAGPVQPWPPAARPPAARRHRGPLARRRHSWPANVQARPEKGNDNKMSSLRFMPPPLSADGPYARGLVGGSDAHRRSPDVGIVLRGWRKFEGRWTAALRRSTRPKTAKLP